MSEASVPYADGACMPQPREAYGVAAPANQARTVRVPSAIRNPNEIPTNPD
jgi:hypothetical protein